MVLDLFEGCELVMNGESWQVERLEPYWGKVALRPVGDPVGPLRQTTISALMRHRDCHVSPGRRPGFLPLAGGGSWPLGET